MLISPATHAKRRIAELDGLRAFAILPVIFCHLRPTNGELSWTAPVGDLGWIGVDLFFVLSGYLITKILISTRGSTNYYKSFIIRRALRILPLYYACTILFSAAIYFYPDRHLWQTFQDWGGPGWFFVYLGNLRIVMMNALPPIFSFSPLWSLQVEEQFYLVYPLLIALTPPSWLRAVLLVCVGAGFLFRCSLVIFFPRISDLAAYVLTPSRMDALALGGLVAATFQDGVTLPSVALVRKVVVGMSVICLLMFTLISTGAFHPFIQTFGYSLFDFTCAAVLSLLIVSPQGSLSTFLRLRGFVYIGQIAYGLYILHAPIYWAVSSALARLGKINPRGTLAGLVSALAVFVVASLSWHYFESRILALRERWSPAGSV